MKKRIKTAVIGCGMIANSAHIPAYLSMPDDFELAAVCDSNKDSAAKTARKHGIAGVYSDAEMMLDEVRPDLVSVCSPNFLHKEHTMLVLRHNASVLCEKPAAFKRRDAEEMYLLAQKQGRYLIACQSMRFTPDRLAAKSFIEQGGLGEIYYGEFSRIRPRGTPTWGGFHIKSISGGGALIDIGVHMIDALLWLAGGKRVVSASASVFNNHGGLSDGLKNSGALLENVDSKTINPDSMDVEDFACGSITLDNGARINFKTAWAANLPEENSIILAGRSEGILLPSCEIIKGAEKAPLKIDSHTVTNEPFYGHFHIIRHLKDVLHGRALPIITPEETVNVATALECIYKSAELKREVRAEELDG